MAKIPRKSLTKVYGGGGGGTGGPDLPDRTAVYTPPVCKKEAWIATGSFLEAPSK